MKSTFIALLTLTLQIAIFDAWAAPYFENHNEAQLTFNGDKKAQCSLIENTKTYKCLNNDVTIYIEIENSMSSVAVDKNKNSVALQINTLKSGNTTIMTTTPEINIPGFLLEKNANDSVSVPEVNYAQDVLNRITELDSFLNILRSKSLSNPAYGELIDELEGVYYNLQRKYNENLNANDLTIEHEDGTIRTCSKIAPEKNNCDVYSCNNPNSTKGSKETTLLFHRPHSLGAIPPVIQTFENDTLKSNPSIKKISNSKTNEVHNTYNNQANDNFMKEFAETLDSSLRQDASNIAYIKNEYSNIFFNQLERACSPEPLLEKYKKAVQNLKEKLANAELKEFISVLDDGTILSNFYGNKAANDHGCYYNGLYYDPEAEKHIPKITSDFPKEVRSQDVISMSKVNELFNSAVNMKDIAWNYKYDGCYARAHLMARRFEDQGIRVDKAWLKGDLYVPGTDIRWNYHVAPLLYVKGDNGEIKKMVIDPSLFDKPVTLEEWDQKMAKTTAKGSVMTAFPFPQNASFYERSALAISSSNPYSPGENIHTTNEEKMEMALDTMEEYIDYKEGVAY